MVVFPSISKCAKGVIFVNTSIKTQMGSNFCNVVSRRTPSSCYFCTKNTNQTPQRSRVTSRFSSQSGESVSLRVRDSERHVKISLANQSMSMGFRVPRHVKAPKVDFNVSHVTWPRSYVSAGLICGLFVSYSSSEPVHAEAARGGGGDDEFDSSKVKLWHGKRVYTDYSITGIPGDGRCMFRSVSHGACLRRGEAAPSESRQRELADDLRNRVANEFIKRREETEWFVEGDFDTYVSQIRKPHVWGGEPELFMASHVLQMPITVYMHDTDAGGLIAIAEYGQEYGKKNPIRVLYHGFGHYDALQIPGDINPCKPRL